MASKPSFIYWDSNVFLHYFEATPQYIVTLDGIIEQLRHTQGKLLTSTIARVEVAFVQDERTQKKLDPAIEQKMDAMWADYSLIEFVELNDLIAKNARTLMRQAILRKNSLRPFDAIHLASADWAKAVEIHTYEPKWLKFGNGALINCPIKEPYVAAPPLPGIYP